MAMPHACIQISFIIVRIICKNSFLVDRNFVDLCSNTSSSLDDIKETLKAVLMMADINNMNEILRSGLKEAVKNKRR